MCIATTSKRTVCFIPWLGTLAKTMFEPYRLFRWINLLRLIRSTLETQTQLDHRMLSGILSGFYDYLEKAVRDLS
jgi:hypothetical protein